MRRSLAVALGGLLAAAAVAATSGCGRWQLARDGEAAVRAYNDAIVVAYRLNDPRGLEKVAGGDEVRRLTALIDLKRNGNLALESRLEELVVLGVEPLGTDRMTVATRERWRYSDRALKPGMPTGPVFVADLWMTWELGRARGAWRVLRGRTERSEYLEPPGFQPGAPAPAAQGARAEPHRLN